ncbi:dicarboxylic amino acid permease [Rhizopogon vinicolor AM-OR11-026]|uniref:Dicarboxylic amino acid permease n=1 Tax=Rhizopogon vinicolor AM-OR11-026 TaxID=1314800 RepID=A0A1B7MZB2_9AGAM|nr:dicarboxylic amino acid permease [Rhizopogon vinicolor AM-OR11-026]
MDAHSDDTEKRIDRFVHNKDETYFDPVLVDPAEELSLHRGLKARQISMITLGGSLGTGLIIGSGTALVRGGPLGLFFGYSFMGMVCYFVMISLGEMGAYLPHKKGFAGYATRYVDPAFGFALGWNYVFKYFIQTTNNVNAAGAVVQYWTLRVPIEVWMVIYIAAIFLINLMGIRVFGEFEFWFCSIKVVSLVGLILMGLIIDLGGNPKHDRIGFRYWNPPYGPLGDYLPQLNNIQLSHFLGFWSTLTTALFSYIGTELIGVTVGEAQNPRKTVPKAIRRMFFRILVFYVGGTFVISLLVPSNSSALFVASKSPAGAAASPFVVATTIAGIRVLNHVINAVVLIFVLSASNSDLYIGSRTLYGLAVERKAPQIFAKVNRYGVPWPSLLLNTLVCFLTFLNATSSSSVAFGWFANLIASFGAITWMCISYTHIAFMRALKAQGIDRNTLPYKAPFQPYASWFALIFTGIVLFFNGFSAFIPFVSSSFITSYIAIPIFLALWVGYKVYHRTTTIPASEADLFTGKREIDEEEERFLERERLKGPRSRLQQIWDAL